MRVERTATEVHRFVHRICSIDDELSGVRTCTASSSTMAKQTTSFHLPAPFRHPPSAPANEGDAIAVTPDRTDDIQRDLQRGPKRRPVESQFAAGHNFTTLAGVGEAINGAARADPRNGLSNSRRSTRENRNFTFTFGRGQPRLPPLPENNSSPGVGRRSEITAGRLDPSRSILLAGRINARREGFRGVPRVSSSPRVRDDRTASLPIILGGSRSILSTVETID